MQCTPSKLLKILKSSVATLIPPKSRRVYDNAYHKFVYCAKRSNTQHKFEMMVGCGQPIESNLHRHLTEHLNAEIVLRTITDLDVAMQWLSSTFLYVRARKNPHHYGINVGYTQEQIDKKLLEMCQIDLNKLVRNGMITIDENIVITPNVTGKIMAKYYVAFETMKLFTQISGSEILMQILALISKCQEFAPMRLRVNDKKTLNLLNKNSNKNTIRFPLNGKIKTWDMKVNCIIQAVLGNLDILDHSILNESLTIMRNGERIAKCLIEYLETRGRNCYSALLSAVTLAKCFHTKLWENSSFVSKQLTGIGSVMSKQLANSGKTTFKKIMDSNPRDIELIIKKKPPMGSTLVEEVTHIPRYNMSLEKLSNGKQLELGISLENVDDVKEKLTVNVHSTMVLLVGSSSNEILVYEKYAHSYMLEHTTVKKTIEVNGNPETISAHFISDDWVGFDCSSKVEMTQSVVQKSTKKTENTKSKGPTYMQMFMDMYMKAKKKPTVPARKDITKQEVTSKAAKLSNVGAKNPKYVKEQSSKSIDCTNLETKKIKKDLHFSAPNTKNDVNNDVQDIEELSDGNDLNTSQNLPFPDKADSKEGHNSEETAWRKENVVSEVNSPENVVEAKSSDVKVQKQIDVPKPSYLINIQDRVSKTPSVFHIAKKYGMSDLQNDETKTLTGTFKRKSKDVEDHTKFEDSLYKEDVGKKQTLQEFKFPTKKKFSHNPETENLPDSTEDSQYYTVTEILEPREKQKDTKNQDKYDSDMDDLPEERRKENMQKTITWRSPLVFSPAEKFSPKIRFQNISLPKSYAETDTQTESTNETSETSTSSRSNTNLTINILKTPRQSKINTSPKHRNRPTHFPLADKDYEMSMKQEAEEPFDICSTSFLEKLGMANNQYKSTPKFKKTHPSPALNYYSQLISQPIVMQKRKTQETPHRNNETVKMVDVKNKTNFGVSTEPVPIKIPKSEYGENYHREGYSSPHQIRSDRENVRNPLQDITNFDNGIQEKRVFTQNNPIPYSDVRYVPQMDLNRSYMARSNPYLSERHPQRNYENLHCRGNLQEFAENPHVINYDSYAAVRNTPTRYNYCDYAKIPQTSQLGGNICGRPYWDTGNVPPYSNRGFEQNVLHSEAINRQFLDPNRDFLPQAQYSQYFKENATERDGFRYPSLPKAETERGYRVFNNPQTERVQNHPEMMSLQHLSQRNVTSRKPVTCTQTAPLVQRKSFEEKIKEENDPRIAEGSFLDAVSEQQNYANEDNTRFPQGCPSQIYRGECSRAPRSFPFDAFSYGQNKPNGSGNNFNGGNFNEPFAFEEKPNVAEENLNLTQNLRLPEQVYSQRNVNHPLCSRSTFFQDWDLENQDFGSQNDFPRQQCSNLDRSFMAPARVYYPEQAYSFPMDRSEMQTFPPNNDKEYVMNKFLFSLNHQ